MEWETRTEEKLLKQGGWNQDRNKLKTGIFMGDLQKTQYMQKTGCWSLGQNAKEECFKDSPTKHFPHEMQVKVQKGLFETSCTLTFFWPSRQVFISTLVFDLCTISETSLIHSGPLIFTENYTFWIYCLDLLSTTQSRFSVQGVWQNGWGWMGSLEVILVKWPCSSRSSRAVCSGLYPDVFWRTPKTEIPTFLWATCSVFCQSNNKKTLFFLCTAGTSYVSVCPYCLLLHYWVPLRRAWFCLFYSILQIICTTWWDLSEFSLG